MELARITGTVVATRQYEGLEGVRLLLAEPLDENLRSAGDMFVVADATQAGVGDIVSWIGGREATLTLPEHFVPIDAAVVSIVDQVDARSLA
ncbi:MAG: EutN/CcmL family microcompartment protein [Deltaproteobacteria bacterium]|nr:EutN/CcmL family microcompartment protein [Deltaproteobacteria bacterium]